MLKFELRKLATVVLSIAVVGMMAACSGSSSSTDDALSHPGDNYMGSLRFDVNPQAESVEVTPIGSPFSGTKIAGNGGGVIPNVTVSTLPAGCRLANNQMNTFFALVTGVNASCTLLGANGTLTYTAVGTTLAWRAPFDTAAGAAQNVSAGGTFTLQSATANNSITVVVAPPPNNVPTANRSDANLIIQRNKSFNVGTGQFDFNTRIAWNNATNDLNNVRIGPNSSTRMGVATTNSAKCSGVWSTCLPGNDPAVTYVADSTTDGPVTVRRCNAAGVCTSNIVTRIHAGCGSVLAHWTLTEAAGTPYTFWADLYGDTKLISPVTSNTWYDDSVATVYIRTYKFGAAGNAPPEGIAATQFAPGEWFYAHYYVDQPGNNHALPYDPAIGVGDKRAEDTGNVAAWAGGTNSTATYWSMGSLAWSIRWDPAVIELFSNNTNDTPGSAAAKFNTATGTQLSRIYDSDGTADGWDFSAGGVMVWSNKLGMHYNSSAVFAASGSLFMKPCGLQAGPCTAGDGFANRDIDVARIALHIRSSAVPGQGSYLHTSWDGWTNLTMYRTEGNPTSNAGWANDVNGPQSLNWPLWCSLTPGSACYTTGQVNQELPYVCVQ